MKPSTGPSECGSWWDYMGWRPMNLALSFPEPYLCCSTQFIALSWLCYITPFSPLLSWSHRNRALFPIICLMFKPGPWISFCSLSRPQSPHSITNPYQLSCGSISWILTLPISTAATLFSLQPLQWLPNGFPCSDLSLLMESPDSSQSELSKNKISSGYIPA